MISKKLGFLLENDNFYNPKDALKPSEFFNKPVIGTIEVEDLTEHDLTYKCDVIDINPKFYVCNSWHKFDKKIPQLIPKMLVVKFTPVN